MQNLNLSQQGGQHGGVNRRIIPIAADVSVLRDVALSRRAYELIGLGWLYAPTRWPLIGPLADLAYGLWACALAARHGLEVMVLEAHTTAGGAAHGFSRRLQPGNFHFESGPSLWAGLGSWPSTNPLAQVLRAVGEAVPVARYRNWGLLLPEGPLRVGVGLEPFLAVVRQLRGPGAEQEWQRFMDWLEPSCRAARALPLLGLRSDGGLAATLGSQALRLLAQAPALATLFGEWFEPEAKLDYPIGGSPAVVQALVRGLEKHGGELRLGTPVEGILVEGNRAIGVLLRQGEIVRCRRG